MGSLGFGAAYKKKVRDEAGAYIELGGFGEVLARYESYVDLDPAVKDRWGIPSLAVPLQVRGQREGHGRGHGGLRQGDPGGSRHRGGERGPERPDRGLVDPRAGDGAHGQRPQDLGAQPVPAVARRQEPLRGGRQQPRERLLPEPHLDDHGPVLALLRSPGGRASRGGTCERQDQPSRDAADRAWGRRSSRARSPSLSAAPLAAAAAPADRRRAFLHRRRDGAARRPDRGHHPRGRPFRRGAGGRRRPLSRQDPGREGPEAPGLRDGAEAVEGRRRERRGGGPRDARQGLPARRPPSSAWPCCTAWRRTRRSPRRRRSASSAS